MSLRTRLRIAIVALVVLIVTALSLLYLADFTQTTIQTTNEKGSSITYELMGQLEDRIKETLALREKRPTNAQDYKAACLEIVKTDPRITAMLQRARASVRTVGQVAITDGRRIVLAASDDSTKGQRLPDIDVVETGSWVQGFMALFSLNRDFAYARPLVVSGDNRPFLYIIVVTESLFLRHALAPAFGHLRYAFVMALGASVSLAFWLPNLVLRPLERISQKIDSISAGDVTTTGNTKRGESAEFADVQTKLNLLGQQFRGAREDAVTLRTNIDRLLSQLEEAVLLFDSRGRLVVAGELAGRVFGRDPKQMLGRSRDELFPAPSELGAAIQAALTARVHAHDLLFEVNGKRIIVGIDPLEEPGKQGAGALVRIRDAETRQQLGQALDLSSRLAAISRLTGGVAHEIKNPLNAIALHLEVLKTKLDTSEPEIGVISREIQRLDRVVKTFLDFNRPVELQMAEFDLAALAGETAEFLTPQAKHKGVRVESGLDGSLPIRGDRELLRQAILNVMVNGIEAMGEGGGRLIVQSAKVGKDCLLEITDTGPGIPEDVQKKIFNLYFTTKEKGSGIGLAMTFRLVQLHGGTIEILSKAGHGATFRMSFPEAVAAG
jgi:signal transduction histidine kinase